VAFVTGEFPAISETFVLGQITGLLDRGVDVRIFSYERPVRTSHHPDVAQYGLLDRTTYLARSPRRRWMRRLYGVLGAPRFCLGNVRFLSYLRSMETLAGFVDVPSCSLGRDLRRVGPFDIVHAQFGFLGAKLARLRAAGIVECPLVTSFRGGDTTVRLSQDPECYRNLFRWGDAFLPVSRFLGDRLESHGCPASRTVVHHSALNLNDFPFREHAVPTGGPIRLLCIARLVEVKGVRYAIEAVRLLRNRGIDVGLRVLGDGPLRAECENLIATEGLQEWVVLEGDCVRTRVREFLERSHILLCPSIIGSDGAQEGMPNAVKEAMACGLPVVATNTGGIPELIEDGVTGALVPQQDAGAMAAAVERIVGSPEACLSICRNARRVIEDGFDGRRLNDRLVGLYRDLMANPNWTAEWAGPAACEPGHTRSCVESAE
jgi:colanic acid/amylovoran biosynthesis glycosyltransferase